MAAACNVPVPALRMAARTALASCGPPLLLAASQHGAVRWGWYLERPCLGLQGAPPTQKNERSRALLEATLPPSPRQPSPALWCPAACPPSISAPVNPPLTCHPQPSRLSLLHPPAARCPPTQKPSPRTLQPTSSRTPTLRKQSQYFQTNAHTTTESYSTSSGHPTAARIAFCPGALRKPRRETWSHTRSRKSLAKPSPSASTATTNHTYLFTATYRIQLSPSC